MTRSAQCRRGDSTVRAPLGSKEVARLTAIQKAQYMPSKVIAKQVWKMPNILKIQGYRLSKVVMIWTAGTADNVGART